MDLRTDCPQRREVGSLIVIRDETNDLDMVMPRQRADELEWPDTDT
jgi:hypothetical protein